MAVVEIFGGKYLWVDCLCIITDVQKELKTMIHSMDRVYNAANLTIVAATGEDADAGLPGLYAGTRNIQSLTASVGEISHVEVGHDIIQHSTARSGPRVVGCIRKGTSRHVYSYF